MYTYAHTSSYTHIYTYIYRQINVYRCWHTLASRHGYTNAYINICI